MFYFNYYIEFSSFVTAPLPSRVLFEQRFLFIVTLLPALLQEMKIIPCLVNSGALTAMFLCPH